ncbi:MAG: helix-turn-helix domain-containing protein [Cellulosilyticaceae bacterium]
MPPSIIEATDLGSKIKYHRLCQHLTQKDLATKCGVHVDTIKRYESHNKEVTPSDLVIYNKIAAALQIDINALMNDYFKFISNNAGQYIKNFRLSLALTQKEFGKLINVNRKTILRWENGMCQVSYENYVMLLKLVR